MLISCCSGRSFFPLDAERVVARRAVYAYVAIYAYVRSKFHRFVAKSGLKSGHPPDFTPDFDFTPEFGWYKYVPNSGVGLIGVDRSLVVDGLFIPYP
jgi:hypothetical protein